MRRLVSSAGIVVSYDRYGSGPPLVLVHGAFSDHATNWEFVKPLLESRFTIFAIARRGRGATTATEGHTIEDEAGDVLAVLSTLSEPALLLGHSYGAHVALAAATRAPRLVRKLVLYEAPWPNLLPAEFYAPLERLAREGRWDEFATTFFRDGLLMPAEELDALKQSPLWAGIVAGGKASLEDMHSLRRYLFDAERFRGLRAPTLLQIGTETPRHLYVTGALAAALPDVRIGKLAGQAHVGMTTAPELYVASVLQFLFE